LGAEKRVYKRFKDNIKISYRLYSTPSPNGISAFHGESSLHDISSGGLLFVSKESIPIDSFLEIEINVPKKQLSINITGRVVRVEEIIHGEEYEVGFVFKNVFEQDYKLLMEHLDDMQ
jgi:c-di-GMP-binding flagellar brake protein YcgR